MKSTRGEDGVHLVPSGHLAVRQEIDDNSVEFRTGCALGKTSFFLQTNQTEKHSVSRWIANTSGDTATDRVAFGGLVTKTSR